jgi:peptidyl-tRNA hydrolase
MQTHAVAAVSGSSTGISSAYGEDEKDVGDSSSGSSSGTSGRKSFRAVVRKSGYDDSSVATAVVVATSATSTVPTPPPPPSRCMIFFDIETTGASLRDNFVPCLGIAVIAINDRDDDPLPPIVSAQPVPAVPPASAVPSYYRDTTTNGEFTASSLWRGSEQWRRQRQQQSSAYQHRAERTEKADREQQQQQRMLRKAGEPYVVYSKKWFVHAPPREDHTNRLARSWDKATLDDFWYQRANQALYSQIVYALSQTGVAVDARTAMHEFVAVCTAATHGGRTECTLFSDTSGFDFSWLSYYLAHYGPEHCPSPAYVFGAYRPVRDVSSFFAGFALSMPGEKSKQARYPHREAMRRLGLSDADWAAFAERCKVPLYDHDPEHDAIHVGMRSAWIMWSMNQLRAQDWRIAIVVRTDLRMKENRALSHCAHAAVGAFTRASDKDVERWQTSGSPRDLLRCADAQALFAVRDAARDANLNHYLYCSEQQQPLCRGASSSSSSSLSTSANGSGGGGAVPSVLAIGPMSAESLRRIVGHLKPWN